MNTTTNELRLLAATSAMAADFLPLPDELQGAAKKKLAGKSSTHVSFTSGGKLSKWAAGQRKKETENGKRFSAA